MSAELLIGNWKLVSWQIVTRGEAKDLFGTKPKGFMILTRERHAGCVDQRAASLCWELAPAERIKSYRVTLQRQARKISVRRACKRFTIH